MKEPWFQKFLLAVCGLYCIQTDTFKPALSKPD